MASAELQSKLQKRLQRAETVTVLLPNREFQGRARRGSDPAVQHQEEGHGVAPESEEELLASVEAAERDRDMARQQMRAIEACAVANNIELGAEVARLRVEIEVLRRDLEAAQTEVHKFRGASHVSARRESALQERVSHTHKQAAVAEARRSSLMAEAAGKLAGRDQLLDKVRVLEEEVAGHVVERVRLEALLHRSAAREVEMRRLLAEAKARVRPEPAGHKGEAPVISKVHYALDKDDDEDDHRRARGAGDLEFSYEGLDLASYMSVDRTAEPADDGGSPRAGGERAKAMEQLEPEDADVSDFEAPLRILQLALAKIQHGSRGSAAAAAAPAVAGTGEAGDASMYDEHVGRLQEVLEEFAAKQAAPGQAPLVKAPEELPPSLAEPAPRPLFEAQLTERKPVPTLSGFRLFSPYVMLGRKYT